jgi:NADH dehydrogenase
VEYVLTVTGRRRLIVSLPAGPARLQARALEFANTISFGLLPDSLKLTRDQVDLLQVDNVVSAEAARDGRTMEGLRIRPTSFEAVVPQYLVRFRSTGQFDVEKPV